MHNIYLMVLILQNVISTEQIPFEVSLKPSFRDYFESLFRPNQRSFEIRAKELREVEGCGKRPRVTPGGMPFNECLWDCEWRHNPFFSQSVVFDLFQPPFDPFKARTQISTPRVPKDLSCLRDCIEFPTDPQLSFQLSSNQQILATCLVNLPFGQTVFQCYRSLRYPCPPRILIAQDFVDMAMEFCELAMNPEAIAINLFLGGNCLNFLSKSPLQKLMKEVDETQTSLQSRPLSNNSSNDFSARISIKDNTRIFGASTFPTIRDEHSTPWMCSLRTRGYRGRHRCGVTLLSGPTEGNSDPVVIVGAAHCNYICKERDSGNVLETCCCRPQGSPGSCNDETISSYCRGNPVFALAEPDDLQIVCGEFSIESPYPEYVSVEKEQVLDIKRIINHPDYQPNRGPGEGGPIEGNDISVYIVDESRFRMDKNRVWPACFPKVEYPLNSKGFFAGWQASTETFQEGCSLPEFRFRYWYPKQKQVVEVPCRDPAWMNSNTFYPAGTACYVDPSFASCHEFGNSGSGIVRKWRTDMDDGEDQYSFVGPLSISKGCDRTRSDPEFRFVYRGENPSVVTDAYCFLDWIAEQYGLKLPETYRKKSTCSQSRGDRSDVNKRFCRTSIGTYCDFNLDFNGTVVDQCRLYAPFEGIAFNVNLCLTKLPLNGTTVGAVCANNCLGVDPNAIIGAGIAAVTATGFGALSAITPMLGVGVLGLGAVGAAGVGGAMLTRSQCPPLYCRVGNQCCLLVSSNGRVVCPSQC